MDKIVESLAKLLPFEYWGMKRDVAEPISIIVLSLLAILATWLLRKFLKRLRRYKGAVRAIVPQFDLRHILRLKRYFISPHFQNASPTRQEEPGFPDEIVSRSRLIPFFIRTAFNQRLDSARFYLILGDSGMGKTTFLVNLYLQYHRPFSRSGPLAMKLLRLSDPDTFRIISSVEPEKAHETILLLDALDEDSQIYPSDTSTEMEMAFRRRVDQIVEATRSFAVTVMTCRTQYFPGQENDPYELKIRRADEEGFYIFKKLYISPFTIQECRRYLDKKYGILLPWNRGKKRRALKIIAEARNLIMRPMLLSYIDYLAEDPKTHQNISSIYESLVKSWLDREAVKRKPLKEREIFIENLHKLSRHLACEIYRKWKRENRLFLTQPETLAIATQFGIELYPQEITGQSLLTSDGAGNWKFAHKSIFEFFLAKELTWNLQFLGEFSFAGQDMAQTFYFQTNLPLVPFKYSGEEDQPKHFFATVFNIHDALMFSSPQKREFDRNYTLYTLSQAMKHCNDLNIDYKYQPVYDDKGDFADPSAIKGFRLPSLLECRCILSQLGAYLPYEFSEKGPDYPYNKFDWCFDTDGIHLVGQDAIYKKERSTILWSPVRYKHSTISSERDYCAFRVVFIP